VVRVLRIRLSDERFRGTGRGPTPVAERRRDDMTADIEPYSKTESREDAELPGLILVLVLMAVLTALVLAFS
jgi:hypothetical protein